MSCGFLAGRGAAVIRGSRHQKNAFSWIVLDDEFFARRRLPLLKICMSFDFRVMHRKFNNVSICMVPRPMDLVSILR